MAAALFQTGRFRREDSIFVWQILAGSAVGLLASTLARLYASTYYALGDTRTPLRYAMARVALAAGLGYLLAVPVPAMMGLPALVGAAGLTLASSVAGWLEWSLLRRALNRRIGRTGLGAGYVAKLWTSALCGAAAAWSVKLALPPLHPIAVAVLVLGPNSRPSSLDSEGRARDVRRVLLDPAYGTEVVGCVPLMNASRNPPWISAGSGLPVARSIGT
jgi:putative peptidoglycan lipid II flippase